MLKEKFIGRVLELDLIPLYEAPGRFYHNWGHISNMLENMESLFPTNSLELKLAIYFHDVVYEVGGKFNEELSGEFFRNWVYEKRSFLRGIEIDVQKVIKLIMATKNHNLKSMDLEDEEDKIIYLDLKSLLECDFPTIIENDKKIMKEFQKFPLDKYHKGRVDFLKGFRTQFASYLTRLASFDHFSAYIESVEAAKYNIGVYCGSFNPLHLGHINVIEKAENVFDKVIIAKGLNPDKSNNECFPIPENNYREVVEYHTIFKLFENLKKNNPNAKFTLIRGLRNVFDFQAEDNFRTWVRGLSNNSIDFVYFFCDKEYEHISSSMIRNVKKLGIDIEGYLP